jgi:large subunit ribosomal protein L36
VARNDIRPIIKLRSTAGTGTTYASLRSLKDEPGSEVVRRHEKIFVINEQNPKWKGRQG